MEGEEAVADALVEAEGLAFEAILLGAGAGQA